jgi:peptidoglycan/xylan/chitin deacetylase (PgdA/CDA1 family)
MPATFFVVGKALESNPQAYRDLLDDPLFEVASHSYSHKLFRDHPLCGPAASPEEIREEIIRGKDVVEQLFQKPCFGLRTGCGFVDGLRGAPQVLQVLDEAGFQYVSSQLWGQDYSLPAPLTQSYTYAEDGFPALREFPAHGWHENLLKGNNRIFGWGAQRVLLFPPLFPEAIPSHYVTTPAEEFAYNNRFFIDRAAVDKLTYVSLVWHPWSLAMFDPQMEMLAITFQYVRERRLEVCRFGDFNLRLSAG